MCDGMIRETQMGQLGFFDAEKRLAALSAKGDPLEAIDRLVPWESFRADIEAVVLTPDEMKKSSAGWAFGSRPREAARLGDAQPPDGPWRDGSPMFVSH